MLVLGIESSCDETSAAVVDVESRKVLSNVIASQIALHRPYGGVVPELASREHLRALLPVVRQALEESGHAAGDLGAIAATRGPGLAGSLLVGLVAAKAMAFSLGVPFRGVNHIEAHLLAGFLDHADLEYPFLGLIASGGHTSLYALESPESRRLLASTRDDAAGEAFDKIAKMLGLGYPGGPALEKAAADFKGIAVEFPRAAMKDGSLDFSFSGLKTAVLIHLNGLRARQEVPDTGAVAAGCQNAIIRALAARVKAAIRREKMTRLVLGGGVAANQKLREVLAEQARAEGCRLFVPSMELCLDNGAMIAYAGGLGILRGERSGLGLGVDPGAVFQ